MSLDTTLAWLTKVLQMVLSASVMSSLGCIVAFPLLRAGRRGKHPRRFFVVDILALITMMAIVIATCRISVHKAGGGFHYFPIYATGISVALTFWWVIVVNALSRLGVTCQRRRAIYLLWLVLFAFMTPLSLALGLENLQFNSLLRYWLLVIIPVPCFVACFPLSRRLARGASQLAYHVPVTIPQLFADRIAKDGDRVALLESRDGEFEGITWNRLAERVHRLAALLHGQLGVALGDRVVQIAENRSDWIVVDLAIMQCGAIHVPLHTTLGGDQMVAQIVDSGSRLVILSGEEQANKLSAAGNLTELSADVRLASHDACPLSIANRPVEHLSALAAETPTEVAAAEGQPDDTATILYTSGTTGEPKGVMLSHRNLVGNAVASNAVFETERDDLRLSFLPWSHVFERTCGLYTWIASGATLAIAEGREQVVANCQELKPTLLNGVPYFFDKLHQALEGAGTAEDEGALAELLGGRIRICCTGGAALPVDVGRWFERQNVTLVEGYGLTETSPVISVCPPTSNRIGSVGPAIDGVEVHIASDGEVLTRGDYLMQGYYNRPEATAAVMADGWFHTGDLGHLDADGYLTISGRKKEIIVTAAGKNVAPVAIESLLTADPLIDQAMVIGDDQKYLVALVVPNDGQLAKALGLEVNELDLAGEAARETVEQAIASRLAGLSDYEQIGNFALLPREFSIDRGELTPTLKLRRHVIAENFTSEIESLYA